MKSLLALVLMASACFGQVSGVGAFGCQGTPVSSAAITNATAIGAISLLTNQAIVAALVQLDQTSTITAGGGQFEVSQDGTNWAPVAPDQVFNTNGSTRTLNPYVFVPSTNQGFFIAMNGATNLRFNLTTALVGSGSVTTYTTAVCIPPNPSFSNLPQSTADAVTRQLLIQLLGQVQGGQGLPSKPNPLGRQLPAILSVQANQTYPAPSFDSCQGANKANVGVSTNANAVLVTGIAGKTIKICGGVLIVTTAGSFSLVEGTGSTCGTGTLAVVGSTTAANGPALAANGGFVLGTGQATNSQAAVPGDSICILLTGTGIVAGNIEYSF